MTRHPVTLEPLIVASGGVYLDVLLGEKPATEPYAEDMRALEKDYRRAEIRRKNAEAGSVEAYSRSHGVGSKRTRITSVSKDEGGAFTVEISHPVTPLGWIALFKGAPLPGSAEVIRNGRAIKISPQQDAISLDNIEMELSFANINDGGVILPLVQLESAQS